jgi:hypothetical protein
VDVPFVTHMYVELEGGFRCGCNEERKQHT